MKLILSLILTIAVLLVGPAVASAHDAKQHKGKQTKGEIVSVAQDRIEMKSGKKTLVVLLSEKPKIEVNGAEASPTALTKGMKVGVIGTTLASGEIVAKEILVQRNATPTAPPSAAGHSGHQH